MKKNTKKINNPFLIFGNLWMLFFVILPIMGVTFLALWRDCRNFNSLLLSFIIASSSLIIAVVNYIKPRNPFEGNWLMPRSTQLTKEEEQALRFLILSKKAKQLVIKTGIFLIIQPFILIFLLNFLFPVEGNDALVASTYKAGGFKPIVLSFLFYSMYSLLFYSFVLERYIIFHWDEIQKMKIELPTKYECFSENLRKDVSLQKTVHFWEMFCQ